ncbi:MAG: hypothetical protein WDN10_01415 [bacterium]
MSTKHGHRKHFSFMRNLEVYAFWTGFASTLISLVQVVIIASNKG